MKNLDYKKDAPVQSTEEFMDRKVRREAESATALLHSKKRLKLKRVQRTEGPEKDFLKEV